MASSAAIIAREHNGLNLGGATSIGRAAQTSPLQLMQLPAEVLQDHLLPRLRAQGPRVQAAFASSCRRAHEHVMLAVAKPLLGQLQGQVCRGAVDGACRAPPLPLGAHPSASAYAALTRLTHLFELRGHRRDPAAVERLRTIEPAAAFAVVVNALDAVLAAAGRSPCALPTALGPALTSLKSYLQAPLNAWVDVEGSASGANILGYRRTQAMVLEQAGIEASRLDLGLFSRPRTLPPVWLYFNCLRVLECRNADLTQLPEAIGHLLQLESLDVSRNRLTVLPQSLQQLPLKRLMLRNNLFETIPDVAAHLPRLRTLDLFGNPLVHAALSPSFRALSVLDLGACGLTQVPTSVFELESLKSLGLCANQITSLPDDLRNLGCLTFLDVSLNRIQYLPAALFSLTQLQALYLHNNPLLELPVFVGSMPRLLELSVSAGDDEGGPPTHSLMLPQRIGRLRAIGSGWYADLSQRHLTAGIEI